MGCINLLGTAPSSKLGIRWTQLPSVPFHPALSRTALQRCDGLKRNVLQPTIEPVNLYLKLVVLGVSKKSQVSGRQPLKTGNIPRHSCEFAVALGVPQHRVWEP